MTSKNTMPDTNDDTPQQPETQPPATAPETLPEGEDPRIATLTGELEKNRDQLLRVLAEADNTRKRLLRERDDAGKYAVAGFARDLLDFADNFSRALGAIPPDLAAADERIAGVIEGVSAMESALLRAFEKHGIRKIEPLGEPFDPNRDEVMFEAPAPGVATGTIIELIEPGYLLHDRLLRPARVGVAKGEPPADPRPGDRVNTEA